MANDREVLKLIWDGKIPCCFKVDPNEIIGQPEPVHLLVPRITFLPLVTDVVRRHFTRFISNEQQDSDIWFESNGVPLKWNYPIGILFDLSTQDDYTLPWTITIHFSNAPGDRVFKCPNKDIVESLFLSSLKEADFLKHRGQVMSKMQPRDHSQLWLGLVNDKFDQFWAVNRRLMESTGDHELFKSIPVRCYNEDGTYIQRLISPTAENGTKKTLRDLLEHFSTPPNRIAVGCRMHGIPVDLETPLQWLSEHLSYPDNFLHICLQFEDQSGASQC